jgi:hypothetical protein
VRWFGKRLNYLFLAGEKAWNRSRAPSVEKRGSTGKNLISVGSMRPALGIQQCSDDPILIGTSDFPTAKSAAFAENFPGPERPGPIARSPLG